MLALRDFDLGYLMGIFDGEGCITASYRQNRRSHWQLSASVQMASEETCLKFLVFGGKTVTKRNKIEGYQQMYNWRVNGSLAIPFLEIAARRLTVKQQQAIIALELARSFARYTQSARTGVSVSKGANWLTDKELDRREELVMKMRNLNGARSRFAGARP